MRFLLVLALTVPLALVGCFNLGTSCKTVKGNGKVITEARMVAGFDAVSISGVGKLDILPAEEDALTIETDENLLPLIHSTVQGGRLHLGPSNIGIAPSRSIHYVLKCKQLRSLHCSGATSTESRGITARSFDLSISGACSVKLAEIHLEELNVGVSGASHLSLAGTARQQTVGLSGASRYEAENLETENLRVEVTGACSLTVWARNALTAHLSGASSLDYYGAPPRAECHTSGTSHVKSRGAK